MEKPASSSGQAILGEKSFESNPMSSSSGQTVGSEDGSSTITLAPGYQNDHDVEKTRDEPESEPRPTSKSPSVDFPDGGFQAWSVVLGGWCCLFASFGWIMCMGVFQDYYQNNILRSYSPSTIAWISSTQASIMFIGAPVFGKIFDNYGPGFLLLFGSFFQVFGLMMLSISKSYYQVFLTQGICSALGTSALFYAGNNTVGRWFAKKRALATGVVSSGSSTGGVVVSIMAERLIPQVGFGWAVRVIGFLYLFLLILAMILVRSRLEHRRTPFVILDFVRPLKSMPVFLTALASFFFFLGVFIPYDFLIAQARSAGMSHSLAANLIAILNATSVFGRILPAWAGDKFGRFNVMIMITYLSAIFVFAIWIPARSNSVIIVFTALYGFTSGSFVAMIPALVAQLSPIAELGLRLGTNSLAVSVAVLLGNPIGGALISADGGSFVALQIFAGATMVVGASLFVLARMAQSGLRLERI